MKTIKILLMVLVSGVAGFGLPFLVVTLAEAHAQSIDDRLVIELQSLIKGSGTGVPTMVVINSSGEAITTITMPTPDSGYIWSDPFTPASTWRVQRAGVTYTLAGDKLLGLFVAAGKPVPVVPSRAAPPPVISR